MPKHSEKLASQTRTYRRLHKLVAVPLFVFLFLVGLTGVLLGWKKQIGLTPSTKTGINPNPTSWISIDSLHKIATAYATSLRLDDQIDRIDIRPEKATAKVVFVKHYTELQIDCSTGKVLSVEKRMNDFVEHLHDGTIIDRLLGTAREQSKISYTTITSFGLMLLAFTGFWMWLNPQRIRKMKSSNE